MSTHRPIRRLLIANRGEIAVRLIRGARARGIETVAVFSDADAGAPHVLAADRALHIGPTPARDSYLDGARIIRAALHAEADAVHPGYGFLSENADFADQVEAAGLTFVGPTGDAMRAVGDKAAAKRIAEQAGVPTVPTWAPDAVPADAYPVLVKAAAGGGGRGMRVVRSADELAGALESAAREAAAGFGDDTLLVEQLVEHARHIEIQLLADAHGVCRFIGDRDCSLQRRHQKVVEEAPAPNLPVSLRQQIGEAAVRLALAAGYTNAGTAEFLVDASGSFFFLELNARLQVEHPATEMAFGLDLVDWQLRIAEGEPLTLEQSQLSSTAHAIEVRIYAEDPVTFLPTGGRLLEIRLPRAAPGVRVDHALAPERDVAIAYDPLLAKVIVAGDTREDARRRLIGVLEGMALPGVITNTPLLLHALALPEFVRAEHTIGTLEANLLPAAALEPPAPVLAAARRTQLAPRWSHDPFAALGAWRGRATPSAADTVRDTEVHVVSHGDHTWVTWRGRSWELPRETIERGRHVAGAHADHGDRSELVAPMPGTVIKVVPAGTAVRAGEPVVVLEAMKMENALSAPWDGVVAELGCAAGELVAKGTLLAAVERSVAAADVAPVPTA